MSNVVGYQYKGPKASFINRIRMRKEWIIFIAVAVFFIVACLLAYFVGGAILFNHQEAHRLDNLSEEQMAIDYCGRQYLAGEVNYMVPEEVIRLEFKDVNGTTYMSAWTDNAYYYGPATEYRWNKIELREPWKRHPFPVSSRLLWGGFFIFN